MTDQPASLPGSSGGANQPFTDDPLKLGHTLYALFAAGFVTGGLTSIAGLILALLVRDKHRTTWLDSHLTWLIRTAIIGLIVSAIGFVLLFVLIGFPLLFALAIWVIYRIIKGWLAVSEARPLAAPEAWL